ncbi:MAG: redoxin domain-containing protein [Rubrobacteraceae bacterium]|nr:redoxin domain-containing protein [Rubrobacteraceae bacterium]
MRGGSREFEKRGARVALVSMADPEQTARFCEKMDLPFECLSDPERHAYRAFGLRRGNILEVAGPRNWGSGIRAVLEGQRQGPTAGDPMQLPGAFVFDASGRLRLAHYARASADNPPNEVLLEALDGGR